MLKGPNQLDERVPMEVGTIQVNFCKNPQCQNFGIPASTKRQPRGRGAVERGRDTYSVVGSGRGTPMLRLQPLQTGYGWQTAGYLPRLLQFRGSWQGQADPGNAVGTGKGQDNC